MTYVFLHGLGQGSSSWESTAGILSNSREVYCPHFPKILSNVEITYSNLYQGVVEYCKGLNQPIHLCGLSLGGILALNYAIDYPENVESLIVIGGQYKVPKKLLKFQNILFRFAPKSAFAEMGFRKKEFLNLTRSMLNINFSNDLLRLSCRTLIVCGEKDYINKKASKELARNIPNAKLEFIPNVSHEVNVQAPVMLANRLEMFYKESR